ncbi:probable glutathione S-transferase parC [Hibiscus syriacus]|uniref:probable glutathione S-transferase parC n=1 Tax=Hibiscus syriacus TaxID=106335 RepID=UPI00192170AA|nr:probable glutathione S-transferase parC [Hibiscus syriacus]
MADDIALLDFWHSPFAMRVRIALAEKGLEYESKEEDLSNKSSLLLNMNPVYKQIPVLIHKGKPICESLIIVEYIDEVWPHKPPLQLLPANPYDKAKAKFWADYIDKKIYPTGKLVWGATGEVQEAAKKDIIENLKELEGELGEKPYFGGESFGFTDVALIPFYTWFYALETCGDFSIIQNCPKLVAWTKRCMQRESVSKSLPDQYKVYCFLMDLKKKFDAK